MKLARIVLAGGLVAATAALAQAPTPAAAPAVEPSLPYTVQKSDKLIRLSRDLLVRPNAWNEVAAFNRMKDPNFITPGQVVQIPLRLLKFKPAGGRIVSAEGSVQLGGAAAVVGASLPEGARLQVGANSSAVLELGDGSRVKLLPNTLAEVVSNREYAMRDPGVSGSSLWFSGLVRLAQGTLETIAAKVQRRATPLQIETPTSLVGVRATEFRVAYDDPVSRNARTEVTEGLVRADNPAQGSNAELPRGTGANINPAEREIRVVQLLPAPDLSALPAEVRKPAGAWPMPTLAGAASFRVQVASDEKFDKVVRDLKVTTASVDLGSLDVGNWYARIRGIDPAGIEGFDAVKRVAVAVRIVRLSSALMRTADGRTELNVAFDQPVGAVTGILSREPSMAAPLAQAPLADGRWALGVMAAGTYYVQFRVELAGGGSVTTDTARLEISPNWGVTVFDSSYPLQPLR